MVVSLYFSIGESNYTFGYKLCTLSTTESFYSDLSELIPSVPFKGPPAGSRFPRK